jgi:hypothetical protein
MMTFESGAPTLAVLDKMNGRSTMMRQGAEAQYSPDGKLIAHATLGEVVIGAVGSEARTRVSVSGGGQPRWSGDGKRLFYLAPDRKLMEVAIDVRNDEIMPGPPRPLFQTLVIAPWFGGIQYDVTKDASRFVVNSLKPEAPLTLVSNWPELLRR